MDIALHFFVSLGLTTFLLLLASNSRNAKSARSSRFWASSDRMRTIVFTTATALSVIGAIAFGLLKESFDQLGYGNVELSDFIANLAGIWAGAYLVLHRIRKETTRRRSVRFSFQSVKTTKNADEFLRHSLQKSGENKPSPQESNRAGAESTPE